MRCNGARPRRLIRCGLRAHLRRDLRAQSRLFSVGGEPAVGLSLLTGNGLVPRAGVLANDKAAAARFDVDACEGSAGSRLVARRLVGILAAAIAFAHARWR